MSNLRTKHLVMSIDYDNGIKHIPFGPEKSYRTVSVSDDGSEFLDSIGADVVLEFDKNNKLVGIELLGL